MGVGYGQLGHIQVSQQNSFGVMGVASLTAVPIITEGVVETIGDLVETGMRARHMAGPSHEGPHAVAGPINMEPLPEQMGRFLGAACGFLATTIVDSANIHKFAPLVSSDRMEHIPFIPLTVVIDRDVGSADAYLDMVVNALTFEMANSQLLTMNVDMLGTTRQGIAGAAPTYPVGLPWVWDQASMSIGGVGIEEIVSLTWNHNNNLEQFWTHAGSKSPQRIRRTGFVEVTVEATILMTTAVHSHLHSLFLAKSENQILINYHGITSPGSIRFDMPQARTNTYAWNIAGPGQIEATMQFMAKFDETSSYLVEYTLTNSVPSYGA